MNFGNIKKWELITLGAAAVIAIVFRVLEETGTLTLPRVPVIVFIMVLAAVLFLRRPVVLLAELARKKAPDKETLSAAGIDLFFALIAEGVLLYLLLNGKEKL